MLIFADKHTQSAFHDVIHHEARLETGGTVRLLRECIVHRCLLFANDSGMSLVELYASGIHDVASLADGNLCRDFDFCLYSIPVDEHGYGIPELADRTKWRRVFNGGIINHGSSLEPQWSMHT